MRRLPIARRSPTTAAAAADADATKRYAKLHDDAERHHRALELKQREVETRLEAVQKDFDALRAAKPPAPKPAAAAPAAAKPAEAIADTRPAPAAPSAAPGDAPSPTRADARNPMPNIEIQIDGSPAWLIDLSLSGAQILATIALKPNRVVKLTLPLAGKKVLPCKGKIMWAKLEPGEKGLRYRAGVSFTDADGHSLEAFLRQHLTRA